MIDINDLNGTLFTLYLFFLCSFFYYQFVVVNETLIEENDEINPEKKEKEEKIVPKYEDKYIDQIHQMNPDFNFTDTEITLKEKRFLEEKEMSQKRIQHVENEIVQLYRKKKENESKKVEDSNEDCEEDYDYEEYQEELIHQIQVLEKKLIYELNAPHHKDEYLYQKADDYVIEQRIEKLKNSFVMEKTPLGNVVMYYNSKRETFEYYSDNTIPYRFLEVVARKYVITFHCRSLYIGMEEELQKYEKKLEEQRVKKEQDEKEQLEHEHISISAPKKNVFAKFKSYNKEARSGRVNKAPPPKNSIPNRNSITNNRDEKVLLKENSNRYTYAGRFSNFSPLQKIQRKQVDKKFAMSFAEFKKIRFQENI